MNKLVTEIQQAVTKEEIMACKANSDALQTEEGPKNNRLTMIIYDDEQ